MPYYCRVIDCRLKVYCRILILPALPQRLEMPYSGTAEWRARIGQWENRKLKWYKARYRCRLQVFSRLSRAQSEVPVLLLLLLVSVTDMYVGGLSSLYSSLAGRKRCCTYDGGRDLSTTPTFLLLLALSLLLVAAGDVEINPGPLTGENEKST